MTKEMQRIYDVLSTCQQWPTLSSRLSEYYTIVRYLEDIAFADVFENGETTFDASFVTLAFRNCLSVLTELCNKYARLEKNAQKET